MKLINDSLIFNNTKHKVYVESGNNIFIKNNINILNKSLDDNVLKINSESSSISKNYKCYLEIENDTLLQYKCDCDVGKNNNGLCKHLIATIYQFNYESLLMNDAKFDQLSNYGLVFVIDIFNDKAIIIPKFEIYNKKHSIVKFETIKNNILNIKLENNEIYELYMNQFSKEQIDLFNHFFNNENSELEIFNLKYFLIKKNYFVQFINQCFKNNILLINERSESVIYLSNFNDETKDTFNITKQFLNQKISIKKDYNELYRIKSNNTISDYYFDGNNTVFFIHNNDCDKMILYIIEKDDTAISRNFYWYFSHGATKTEFPILYNYIKNQLKIFNFIFDESFIEKNNLLKHDPILSLELVLNEQVKNPVLIVKYKYLDKYFYHIKDDDIELINRKIDKEVKLFSRIEKNCLNYKKDINAFVFYTEEEFQKIIKWMTINKNNHNFEIKIAKNLIYKQKIKSKFKIQSINSHSDILSVNWKIEDFTDEETKKIVEGYVKKVDFVTLSNNRVIDLLHDIDFNNFENQLRLFNLTFDDYINDKIEIKKWNYFILKDQFKDNKVINEFVDTFKNINNVELKLNSKLSSLLKPYQIFGCKWLKTHYKLGTGSILADEMGLGKTIQSISYLDDFYSDKQKHLSLIVTPSSLIYNWKNEFANFSPNLKVCIIDGPLDKRLSLLTKMNDYDVIIVSYNLLKIDLDHFNKLQFDNILIDEGHTIKNHFTKFSKSIKSLNSRHKIVLTGTPMENNALELWSLFDFVMPGFLNDFNTFKRMIANNAEYDYSFLKTKISPFILRRTKKEVLKELPSKVEKIINVEFNEEQQILYANLLSTIKDEINTNIKEKDIEKNKVYILSLLTKLRQLCCFPKLIFENSKTNGSKFDTCMSLMTDVINRGEKILIFSQFTSMIQIFEQEMHKRNIKHCVITGNTNKKERQILVDKFNKEKDVQVFLISLKAGGVGLNLTSASNVIHYDLWWNISIENQASDRTHRIGQKNNVIVYKLVTKNSIEEKIIDIQNIKKKLINSILDFDKISYENLSMKEILSILEIK